jgi:hypothetical protein
MKRFLTLPGVPALDNAPPPLATFFRPYRAGKGELHSVVARGRAKLSSLRRKRGGSKTVRAFRNFGISYIDALASAGAVAIAGITHTGTSRRVRSKPSVVVEIWYQVIADDEG